MLCPFKFKPSVNHSAALHRLFVATDLLQNPKRGLGNFHDHFFFGVIIFILAIIKKIKYSRSIDLKFFQPHRLGKFLSPLKHHYSCLSILDNSKSYLSSIFLGLAAGV